MYRRPLRFKRTDKLVTETSLFRALSIYQRSVTPDRTGIMLIAAIKHISSGVSKPNLVFPARCRHAFKSIKQVDIPRSILCIEQRMQHGHGTPPPPDTTLHNGTLNSLPGDVPDRFMIGKPPLRKGHGIRSEEHTSELQSLMRISYAVFCLKKKKRKHKTQVPK